MVVGRITLFHAGEEEGDNSPHFRGKIEYPDGTVDQISLWRNEHPRVTNGEFFSGQVYTEDKH